MAKILEGKYIKYRKMTGKKSTKLRIFFKIKMNKIGKTFDGLLRKKEDDINEIRNEKEDIIIKASEIKRIQRIIIND